MNTPEPKPWDLRTESWNGTEYWVLYDAQGCRVCQEPTDFSAHGAGAFIITRHGRRSIAKLIAYCPVLLALARQVMQQLANDPIPAERGLAERAEYIIDQTIGDITKELPSAFKAQYGKHSE